MRISISKNSGFCFGVLNAIKIAEDLLNKHGKLFCIGDIVHNKMEIKRLKDLGMITISRNDLISIYNTRILIRAHGEPPATYHIAQLNNLEIIDATCPVVLKLQNRIKKSYDFVLEEGSQLVIFGKKGHPEVEGLMGQTNNQAIVVESDLASLNQIDFSKAIVLYSQTTQDRGIYYELIEKIKQQQLICHCKTTPNKPVLTAYDSICSQVANRGPQLESFAQSHDVIIFVSGKKSSNGQYLAKLCKQKNHSTFMIENEDDLKKEWFSNVESVGICGATSTPLWLMEKIAGCIREFSPGESLN